VTDEKELLIEQVVSAHRTRDVDGNIRPHRAWFDLDEEGREQAFEETVVSRKMEAALDSSGLSTTARLILAKIQNKGT
jgi:hypothetical protein